MDGWVGPRAGLNETVKRKFLTLQVGENCIMRSFVICSSPSIIRIIKSRRMRWAGHVARMGEKRNAYRLLFGEVGWGDVDWIGLAQDRNRWRALVNSVLNLRVP
jgi:hypothetical protein